MTGRGYWIRVHECILYVVRCFGAKKAGFMQREISDQRFHPVGKLLYVVGSCFLDT